MKVLHVCKSHLNYTLITANGSSRGQGLLQILVFDSLIEDQVWVSVSLSCNCRCKCLSQSHSACITSHIHKQADKYENKRHDKQEWWGNMKLLNQDIWWKSQLNSRERRCWWAQLRGSSVTQGNNEKVWMTVCVLLPTLSLFPRLCLSPSLCQSQSQITEYSADSSVFRN